MKKEKIEKPKSFFVISEEGYYTGLKYGGLPQWSFNIEEAKPLDHENKFITLQNICYNKELILEYEY